MPKTWFAVYTAVGCEVRATAGLVELARKRPDLDMDVYCPMATRWWRHARQKKRVQRALLTRYLFIGIGSRDPDFYAIRAINGVESLVGVGGEPTTIRYELIEPLRMAETRGDFDLTREHELVKFSKGTKVKVVGGLFQGFIGEFEKAIGEKRAKVLLKELGRVVGAGPIEVALTDLQPLAA